MVRDLCSFRFGKVAVAFQTYRILIHLIVTTVLLDTHRGPTDILIRSGIASGNPSVCRLHVCNVRVPYSSS